MMLFFVNPERKVEFKIAVTVGFQDINSMFISQEPHYVYTFFFVFIKELSCLDSAYV